MGKIDNEIYKTRDVVDEGKFIKMSAKYNKVYFSSNEDINTLFSNFDFKGKRVLSVLGSGDQAFHFYDRGVKTLDVFDVNKLTIYYFYLRIWTIKYLKNYYPQHTLNNTFLEHVLSCVETECKEEEDAYKYWSLFAEDFNEVAVNRLFLMNGTHLHSPNKIDDLEKIISRLQKKEFDFYNVDISKKINIDKKYDVIYTSNIHEYLSLSNAHIYRDNLYRLLSKNGIVIAADFDSTLTKLLAKKSVFEDKFTYYDIDIKLENGSRHVGHYYVKK